MLRIATDVDQGLAGAIVGAIAGDAHAHAAADAAIRAGGQGVASTGGGYRYSECVSGHDVVPFRPGQVRPARTAPGRTPIDDGWLPYRYVVGSTQSTTERP